MQLLALKWLIMGLRDQSTQFSLVPSYQEEGLAARLSKRWLEVNPLPTNDCKTRHETFTFMMSHPAMSLRDRLCASREGGAGGGGWVHPKGANSMAVSGLSFEQPLVGAG